MCTSTETPQAIADRILKSADAVITNDHFVYTSGKHGSAYVNKDAIYPDTSKVKKLCNLMADIFRDYDIEVVVGPALGGIALAQWTANLLEDGWNKHVKAVFAEKVGYVNGPLSPEYQETGRAVTTKMVIKRGYDKLIKDKRILIVEDILTTGGSVLKTIEAVAIAGGIVVGVTAICNRGNVKVDDIWPVQFPMPEDFKFNSLVNVDMDMWSEDECSLCKQGTPINTDLGHGRSFLERQIATLEKGSDIYNKLVSIGLHTDTCDLKVLASYMANYMKER